jgi:hypothetical protein
LNSKPLKPSKKAQKKKEPMQETFAPEQLVTARTESVQEQATFTLDKSTEKKHAPLRDRSFSAKKAASMDSEDEEYDNKENRNSANQDILTQSIGSILALFPETKLKSKKEQQLRELF